MRTGLGRSVFNIHIVGALASCCAHTFSDRYSFDRLFLDDNHNHHLAGSSHSSNAILTSTGGNQAFDNRQSFTIVQYIIYIQN